MWESFVEILRATIFSVAHLCGGSLGGKRLGAKVRFLWIPDLARPEATALLGVTALSAWVASSTPVAPGQTTTPTVFVVAAVIGTLVFLWSASSAVVLSMGAGSLVSLLQNWLLARDAKVQAAKA